MTQFLPNAPASQKPPLASSLAPVYISRGGWLAAATEIPFHTRNSDARNLVRTSGWHRWLWGRGVAGPPLPLGADPLVLLFLLCPSFHLPTQPLATPCPDAIEVPASFRPLRGLLPTSPRLLIPPPGRSPSPQALPWMAPCSSSASLRGGFSADVGRRL